MTRRERRRRWPWALLILGLVTAPAPWGPAAAAALLAAGAGALALRWAAPALRRRRGAPAGSAPLGRDGRGRAVGLSDDQLGAHALVVGATGAGKSTTLQTILADRIARGHPVVAIDMKGSPAFARALGGAAHAADRSLRVWTPEGPSHWNPLAHGGPTALKDMLISAERFSEPHYQRAAERYLQTALQVLHARREETAPRLSEVVAAMEPGRLRALARTVPEPLAGRVDAYLEGLTPDQRNAASGLATRLALLSESDAGPWLEPAPAVGGIEIDLGEALTGGDVVLLSINSSIYGALGAQLGALAVQNLTSAAGRRLGASASASADAGRDAGRDAIAGDARRPIGAPATVALDEFSALGADNVLSLLARGREAGVGVLLATQELADLERAGRGFRDQVLGITAVTLAHRQEVHESALAISRLAGTRKVWRETRTIPAGLGPGGRVPATRGTLRAEEEPVVHPNAIKRLSTGELVLLSGVPRPTVARVRVTPRSPAPPPRRGIRSRARGAQPPAPGVTR